MKRCLATIELGGNLVSFELQCQSRKGHAGAHTCKIQPFNAAEPEIGIVEGGRLARINWITQSKSIEEIALRHTNAGEMAGG